MTTEPTSALGATIRRLRKERGLSQLELAEKLGISDNAVSQFERGVTVPGVYTSSRSGWIRFFGMSGRR